MHQAVLNNTNLFHERGAVDLGSVEGEKKKIASSIPLAVIP
jgi:hypothetical protein